MKIPINLRVVSIGKTLPGGDDYVTVTGEALSGGTVFQFEIQRRLLAESASLDHRQGSALPAELRFVEGAAIPQDAEPEDKALTVRV